MEGSVKRNSTEENPIPVLMTWHSYLFSYLDDGRARGGMWRVCDAVATAWRVLQISGWIQSTPSFDVTGTLLFVKGTIWILEEIYEFKLRIMIFSYLKTKILFIQKKWSEKSQICNFKSWCIDVEILIGKSWKLFDGVRWTWETSIIFIFYSTRNHWLGHGLHFWSQLRNFAFQLEARLGLRVP